MAKTIYFCDNPKCGLHIIIPQHVLFAETTQCEKPTYSFYPSANIGIPGLARRVYRYRVVISKENHEAMFVCDSCYNAITIWVEKCTS